MNFNRKFTHVVGEEEVAFDVTYNPDTHFFTVYESGLSMPYLLKFDMSTRTWSTVEGPKPKISADDLAVLVQQHFGRSV